MLPLARIGKHMRAAPGILLEVAVGADGDVRHLRADAVDHIIDKRAPLPEHQPFVGAAHAAALPAGQD